MRRTILAVVSFSLLAASSAGAALDGDWTEIAVGDLSTGGLARSGDDLYIVWKDWMTDSIMFLRHDGNSPPMVMSGGTGFTAHPRVYANGGDVHVAWVEDQTLYVRTSGNRGATIGPPMDLTQSPATWSRLLGVDVDGDKTHVIWREAPTAPGGFEWFRGMTIQNGVPGPFVHLMDDTIDVDVSAFSTVDGQIDILVIEDTPSGERLLYRHGFGSMH